MLGSKTNKFFNYLANKIAPPGSDQGQLYPGAGYPYTVPQYAAPTFDPAQYLSSQGVQYTGATANGQSRQHNGHHIQGDDHRTHASDQAQLYNGNVYYANTYHYYQNEGVTATREQQTSSAPPMTVAGPPSSGARSRPDLPPRQESAPPLPPQPFTQDWSKVFHSSSCDSCGKSPLQGVRWKCVSCPDHDVCADCKAQGNDEGHAFRQLPNQAEQPLRLALLGSHAAQGSQFGVLSALNNNTMYEMCEIPRLDPLVIAARNGHFQVCQTLMEKLGGIWPPQCISAAINGARTAPGYMGNLLAIYLESQATANEQKKSVMKTYGI
ncbi:hypothetical protein DOTSEDRAFT_80623 [Dothistroma septosporum NZE10]|uniref:ZZ-type domain-containing protein n=1 Tax=Dothistroma septosporum (strain NZE10 / CBS 128990) TaxID=675120 RepID=M2Y4A0_DOTSN|nr:hypothetical protein DOTSEDRAFT_80623 [Dothistroma septosporum NZE10]